MKPFRILAGLALVALPALPAVADDLSASLSGGGQGVASIQTLNASNLNYAIFADVGNITSADILQGNAVALSLGSNFGGGVATGSASGNVIDITANPDNYSVRVQGSSGTAVGPLVFAATSGAVGPPPGDGRVDTGDTSPCGQNGAGCVLDNQYDVTAELIDQQGQTRPATFDEYTSDTVLASVFNENNVEFLVKVLETCGIQGVEKRWVFAGGATDRPGTIRVREVATGLTRIYSWSQGVFPTINDTQEAHPCP